jgi:hypothetical protein
MPHARDASSADVPTPRSARRSSGLVQAAPSPDEPVRRDRKGAQLGMILALLAGAAFWAAIAVLAIYLRR